MDARLRRIAGGGGLIAIAALALVLAWSGMGRAAPRPMTAKATGAMRIAGSDAEQAIFGASNLAPGEAAMGTVVIRNVGAAPAAVTLSPRGLHDVAGAGGALLSTDLVLTIRDVSGRSNAILYQGPFATLPTIRAGALAKGERRQYSFVAKLPDSPAPQTDDALAGASTGVDYRWALTGATGAKCATRLYGDPGSNRIVGTVGGDRISGGPGRDRLSGGPGDDCVDGGPGRDQLSGGPGDDVLRARDGSADVVDCGPGDDDVAIVDAKDQTNACEHVR